MEPENKPPSGFGKDVNDYLNHYVTVADAKAAAILASNFIVLGGLSTIDIKAWDFTLMFLLSGLLSVISILFSVKSVYPRLTNSGKGLIFWESIRSHRTIDGYLEELTKLDLKTKEIEYGKQNWHVSNVLCAKNRNVRCSLWTFSISLILLIIEYILMRFF